jgi:uncharacterized protein
LSLYLDTSLLVAALTRERRTAAIQRWLAAQDPEQLLISDWVVTEFSSALSLKLRTGELDLTHRADALALFTELRERSFVVLPVERNDFLTAARFVERHDLGLRAGDALHLAIAANHGASLQTLDRKLALAARRLALKSELL